MTRAISAPLSLSQPSAIRRLTGAPIGANPDSATLTDANFPPVFGVNGGAIYVNQLATLWLKVAMYNGATRLTGSQGSVTLDPLTYDAADDDGSRWSRLMFGADVLSPAAPTLKAGDGWVQVRVDGGLFYPRVAAVAGTATTILILAKPGQVIAGERFRS